VEMKRIIQVVESQVLTSQELDEVSSLVNVMVATTLADRKIVLMRCQSATRSLKKVLIVVGLVGPSNTRVKRVLSDPQLAQMALCLSEMRTMLMGTAITYPRLMKCTIDMLWVAVYSTGDLSMIKGAFPLMKRSDLTLMMTFVVDKPLWLMAVAHSIKEQADFHLQLESSRKAMGKTTQPFDETKLVQSMILRLSSIHKWAITANKQSSRWYMLSCLKPLLEVTPTGGLKLKSSTEDEYVAAYRSQLEAHFDSEAVTALNASMDPAWIVTTAELKDLVEDNITLDSLLA